MALAHSFLFTPEPEGGFTVTCPALPGLVSYGKTLKEAREMGEHAATGLIEAMREMGTMTPGSDA
jgi:antitoxin HicB